MTQLLRALGQAFGGHEGVSNTSRARGDGDDAGRTRRISKRFSRAGNVDLSLFCATAQHCFNILQRLRRGNLEDPFADETRHVDVTGGNQQHPLRRLNGGGRQFALRVRRIDHFNAGAPALTLGRRIEQAGAQHTGDHAVRAGRDNG